MLDKAEPQEPEYIRPNKGTEGLRKGRILTDLLRAVSEEKLVFEDPQNPGQSFTITKKEALAKMVWDSALTGHLTTIDGRQQNIGVRDHLDLIKWIYTQMDGPVKQEVSVDVKNNGPDNNNQPIIISTDRERVRRLAELITKRAESEGIRISGSDSESTRRSLLQLVAEED